MKILKDERPKPKWIVAPPSLELWRGKPGGNAHPGKIGGLPPGIREELNGLPQSPSASPDCRYGKVTAGDIADWKRGGFRDWQLGQERRMTIARRCLAWAKMPEMQDKLFGRSQSWLEILNGIRCVLGREPLNREDLGPDEDWDAIPTPKQRRTAAYAMFGLTPEGKDTEEGSCHLGYFGPPRAGSASKKTINPKRK